MPAVGEIGSAGAGGAVGGEGGHVGAPEADRVVESIESPTRIGGIDWGSPRGKPEIDASAKRQASGGIHHGVHPFLQVPGQHSVAIAVTQKLEANGVVCQVTEAHCHPGAVTRCQQAGPGERGGGLLRGELEPQACRELKQTWHSNRRQEPYDRQDGEQLQELKAGCWLAATRRGARGESGAARGGYRRPAPSPGETQSELGACCARTDSVSVVSPLTAT